MCAALIKAELAGLGDKKLRPWIDNYVQYVSTGQFRLADGTLARNRPLPDSLWLDDLYMSVPCLAQAGKLTGDRRYFDDAAKQILQFSERMFVKDKGLYMHAWVQGMQHHPAFHWARANGWAIMAMAELLEVLPEDHPARARILELYREHAAGLVAAPGPRGTAGISCSIGASPTRRPRPARCSCLPSRTASIAAGSTAWRSVPRYHWAGTRSLRR